MCAAADESGTPQVVPIQLDEVDALSSVRIYIPKDLRQPDARILGLKVLSAAAPMSSLVPIVQK